MRLVIIALVALSVVLMPVSVMAKEGGKKEKKGASEKAYEHANENAKFKKEEGWFDKIGKKDDGEDEDENLTEEEKAAKKAAKEEEKTAKKAIKEEEKTTKKSEKAEKKAAKKSNKKGKK